MTQGAEATVRGLYDDAGRALASDRLEEAFAAAVQAADLGRRELGEDHPALADARELLARVLGRRQAAAVAPLAARAFPPELPLLAAQLAFLQSRGRHADCLPLLSRQLQLVTQFTGESPNPVLAKALIDLGFALWRVSDRDAAEPLLAKAHDFYRISLGAPHPSTMSTARELGQLMLERGDDGKRAEPVLRDVLDDLLLTVGLRSIETVEAAWDLAFARLLHGDTTGAAAWLTEALAGYARPDSRAVVRRRIDWLREQSARLKMTRRDRLALVYVEQQLALTRLLLGDDEHQEIADVLNNLGLLHVDLGDPERAETLLQQALGITERTRGSADEAFARCLANLGLIRRRLGEYESAQALFERALGVVRTAEGDDHPGVATTLNNLAGLNMAMGRFAVAKPLYAQALEARRRLLGANDPGVAELLDNQGQLFYVLGDVSAALVNAEQALGIYRQAFGDDHPDVATTLGNLALLHVDMGNPSAAQPLLAQALQITRAGFGRWHLAVATVLRRQAVALRALGRTDAAQWRCLRAIAIERRGLAERHPLRAESLNLLAVLRLEAGRPSAAVPLLECALSLQASAEGVRDREQAATLTMLAEAHAACGQPAAAFDCLRRATAIDDRTIAQAFSIGSEFQRLTYAATIWSRCDYALGLLASLPDRQAAVGFMLDLVLRRKAIVTESVVLQRAAIFGGAHPELLPRLAELDGLRGRIAAETLGAERSGPGVAQAPFADWIARKEALESDLAGWIPEMMIQQHLRAADCATVAAALPADAVLVEYLRMSPVDPHALSGGNTKPADARYVAFVLRADAPDAACMFDLGAATSIDALVATFRTSIVGVDEDDTRAPSADLSGDEEADDATADGVAILRATRRLGTARRRQAAKPDGDVAGMALRAALLDPLLKDFDGRTRLLIATDGDLARLPFEVLPLTSTTRLIDDYQISYVGCGRDALRFGKTASVPGGGAVVAADPDFDLGTPAGTGTGGPFGRLAGSGFEGRRVAQLLGVAALLTKGVLKAQIQAGASPVILHLATHGFFLPDLPIDADRRDARRASTMGLLPERPVGNPLLRSGLALAGANTRLAGGELPVAAQDGLLRAEDVAGMNLVGTDLVVLSACDTGLGAIRAGEGVFGLRRAFAQAGARTLVMSLWKVPDDETQVLMTDFYERLLLGEPRALALRSAQLAMKVRHPDPLYWGAFICEGDPGPLPAVPAI